MVAGHSSTVSLPKTVTWSQKIAHHTKERPRETNAQTTPNALHMLKLKIPDSLERATVIPLRRK